MTDEFNLQTQQRLAKLERFRERGVTPYPPRIKRSHSVAEAIAAYENRENDDETITVQVAGRLVSIRIMGRSTFAHLEDSSGRLQVYLQESTLGEEAYDIFKKDFDLGDFIAVEGGLFTTRTGEITVKAQSYELAAKALNPLPEKWHGLKDTELRYRQRYLDLIANPEVRDIFEVGS